MKNSTKVILTSTFGTLFCLGSAALCKKMGSDKGAIACSALAVLQVANGVNEYRNVKRAENEYVKTVQKQIDEGFISKEVGESIIEKLG
nr:MAG TPA: hypothetical protein [Caudoviricetes sp.]